MRYLKKNFLDKDLDSGSFYNKVNSIITWIRVENYLYRGFYIYSIKKLKVKILKKLGFTRLAKIFIGPSFECNADCPHCYEKFKANDLKAHLTTAECKNIIDQFKKLGGYQAFFCSGEFLLRTDALELIKYCSDRKILTSVTTNGFLLDEKKINDLKNAGLKFLVVSIDSSVEEKHDSLRIKGSFQKATNALKLAKEKGMITHIWTYITRSHSDELEGIIKLGRELGVQSVYVFCSLLAGHLFNKFEENFTFEEREEVRKRYNFRIPVSIEFGGEDWRCRGGGREHMSIAPTGDATFCPPVAYSYGNIREESLKNVLKKIEKDYKRLSRCTYGQCPINFPEYRKNCNAKFMYPEES